MACSFLSLAKSSDRDLEYVLRDGVTPSIEGLLGYEFKGYNLPFVTKILGFRKFKKGFFLDRGQSVEKAEASGYNVAVVQNRLEDPWIALPNDANPKRHAFYRVYRVRRVEVDNAYPHALLLNYALGENPRWNPARLLRDYLVQADPKNPDLLLGKAYFALGPARAFPSFFVLERYNRSSYPAPV
jgi:hypothetical protein